MNLLQLFRYVIRLTRGYGIDIRFLPDLDAKIYRLRVKKKSKIRLEMAENLASEFPDQPIAHLELAINLHEVNSVKQFEQFNIYQKVMQKWLVETKLNELSMEFIWIGMFVGSLGNHYAVENLIRANQNGLRETKKIILLFPKHEKLRNAALFEYFEPFLCIIRDDKVIHAMRRLESYLTLPLGHGVSINNHFDFLDFSANRINMEVEKLGRESDNFCINEGHYNSGRSILEQLNVPKDAWYVTLHVREPGFRGETRGNTTDDWRNANPMDYIDAIKVITGAGGWVFRMGDSSMTPLPKMDNVVDYAHHNCKSDVMDVFLAATCRFCIGTASGYFRIPRYFGVPIIFTNCTQSVQYYSLKKGDLYLPRLLKCTDNNKYLSFHEIMSPPISTFTSIESFNNVRLTWEENTPDELTMVVNEMLDLTRDSPLESADSELQRNFKEVAEACGLKYDGRPMKAFSSISESFINKYSYLLDNK